jgi:GTP pyrophosphokinase
MIGARFAIAVATAGEWHRDQKRKGTDIPYVGHLLAVAAIVVDAGADEGVAIAALLHDAIEDQPERSGGEAGIAALFGDRVSAIVAACSDGAPGEARTAANWRARKESYLQQLPTKSSDALLVSIADKIANARTIVRDLHLAGPSLWTRFHGRRDGTLEYYRNLVQAFEASVLKETHPALIAELAELVEEMNRLA